VAIPVAKTSRTNSRRRRGPSSGVRMYNQSERFF
jgi:hypothetical protein